MPGAPRFLVPTATLLLMAALSARAAPQEAPNDVATLLAWTRQALGGDAALSAVTAFTVKGRRTLSLGGDMSNPL